MPDVRLGAGELGAIDAGLLAGAYAGGLALRYQDDGVGLRVLQRDQAQHQIAHGFDGERAADHMFDIALGDAPVVARLPQGDAEDLAGFERRRLVVGVRLDYHERAPLLARQHLEHALFEAGSDYAVADHALQVGGGGGVHRIGEGDEIAERTHRVRASCANVGPCQRRQLSPEHLVDMLRILGQRHGHCRARRRDVLEGGRRRHRQRFLEFAHQLPSVQRVQHVDERRRTSANPHRATRLERRLRLMRIAAVAQRVHYRRTGAGRYRASSVPVSRR